jgi:hypothetical protein
LLTPGCLTNLSAHGVASAGPAEESGDSADRLNTSGLCFERELYSASSISPFRLTLLRARPNPVAHVFNLLHLSRELIAKPSKVFDSGQFEYRIGQSVAASCKVAKIRSVHRLPRLLKRECKDFSVRPHAQRALYSNLDWVMASSRHWRAGNGQPEVTYAAKSCSR